MLRPRTTCPPESILFWQAETEKLFLMLSQLADTWAIKQTGCCCIDVTMHFLKGVLWKNVEWPHTPEWSTVYWCSNEIWLSYCLRTLWFPFQTLPQTTDWKDISCCVSITQGNTLWGKPETRKLFDIQSWTPWLWGGKEVFGSDWLPRGWQSKDRLLLLAEWS